MVYKPLTMVPKFRNGIKRNICCAVRLNLTGKALGCVITNLAIEKHCDEAEEIYFSSHMHKPDSGHRQKGNSGLPAEMPLFVWVGSS
jgi:hypothetical protein